MQLLHASPPCSRWLMTQKPTPAEVDEFLDSTVLDDDPVLSAALEDSDAAGLPKIAVSAQQGKFLSLLATAVGARRILEIGTLGGFSTIWLARGAGPDGRVTTLEYEPKHGGGPGQHRSRRCRRSGRGAGRRRPRYPAERHWRSLRPGVHRR